MMRFLAQADMSLEDFFKATRESMGEGPKIGLLIVLISLGAALLVLLLILNKRRSKEVALKPINNINRLQRDMLDVLKITKEETRELDRVAKEQGMESSLTLLLCPSILQKAAMGTTGDGRRILAGLIKRICA